MSWAGAGVQGAACANAHSHTERHDTSSKPTILNAARGYAQPGALRRERNQLRVSLAPGRYHSPPGKVSTPACAPTRLYIVTAL